MLATEQATDAAIRVTVPPVTHSRPPKPAAAIELPPPVKRHLGLDSQRSWIIVSEGNEFIWPGYDLRKLPTADQYDYGFLPPRTFNQVITAFKAYVQTGRSQNTPRT